MFEVADDPARPVNTLVLADDGRLTAYRKIHLYDSFGYRESSTDQRRSPSRRAASTSTGSRSG